MNSLPPPNLQTKYWVGRFWTSSNEAHATNLKNPGNDFFFFFYQYTVFMLMTAIGAVEKKEKKI